MSSDLCIRFLCLQCGRKLKVPGAAAGRRLRCPDCGSIQVAPAHSGDVASPEQDAAPVAGKQPSPDVPIIEEVSFAARELTAGDDYRYDVFISYRHVEPDRAWAQWLHKALETYRTPRYLVRERHVAPRLRRSFRDEEELPASADLSREIDTALKQSRFLVVICSPRTPESRWVNREVEQFTELGRQDRILALLIEGEPGEAFPAALRQIRKRVVGRLGITREQFEETEPLAADVRAGARRNRRYLRTTARLRLMACILGVRYDDLRRRDLVRRRRRMAVLGAITAALLLVLSMFAGTAIHYAADAIMQRQNSLQQQQRAAAAQRERLAAEQQAAGAERDRRTAEKRASDAERDRRVADQRTEQEKSRLERLALQMNISVADVPRLDKKNQLEATDAVGRFAEGASAWSDGNAAQAEAVSRHRTATLTGLEEIRWDWILTHVIAFSFGGDPSGAGGPPMMGGPPGMGRPPGMGGRPGMSLPPGMTGPAGTSPPDMPGAPGIRGPLDMRGRPAQPPRTLPKRFLMTGELAAVRQVDGKTLVYLWVKPESGARGRSPNAAAMALVPPTMAPCACIVFPSDSVGSMMADYMVGQVVRVAVQRSGDGPATQPATAPGAPRGRGPQPGPALSGRPIDDYRNEFRTFARSRMSYWCFEGVGLELSEQPESSWISPKDGRAKVPAKTKPGSLGALYRALGQSAGTRGILRARFEGIKKPGQQQLIKLTISTAEEGPLTCWLDMTGGTHVEEFVDYKAGDSVEARITIAGRRGVGAVAQNTLSDASSLAEIVAAGSVRMNFMRGPTDGVDLYSAPNLTNDEDPLLRWDAIAATCDWIQVENRPATLVVAGAPIRIGLTVPEATIKPEMVAASPALFRGKEVSWTGSLRDLVRLDGITRLRVEFGGPKTGLNSFEAFSKDPQLLDDLCDYRVGDSSSGANEKVTVVGVVSDQPGLLGSKAPVLELREIFRVGDTLSQVIAGRPRNKATINSQRVVSGIDNVLRDLQPLGQKVTFEAPFDSGPTGGSRNVAIGRLGEKRKAAFSFDLPAAEPEWFQDYRRKDMVELTVVRKGMTTSFAPEFELLSIERRGDPASRVTPKGRATPLPDVAPLRRQWDELRKAAGNAGAGRRLEIEGEVVTVGKGEPRSLIINHLFFTYAIQEYEFRLYTTPQSKDFIEHLMPGEQIFLEVEITGGPSGPGRNLEGFVRWIAEKSHHDERVVLGEPPGAATTPRAATRAATRPARGPAAD